MSWILREGHRNLTVSPHCTLLLIELCHNPPAKPVDSRKVLVIRQIIVPRELMSGV
jgi:hypothetical protein